ncbi:hypothetical protein D3C86_1724100 [compost metagenome]
MRRRYRAHQPMQATDGGNGTYRGFRQAKGRRAAGDTQVALQRQLQATAQAVTVHCGDQGFVQVEVCQVHHTNVEPGIGSRLIGQEQGLGVRRGRCASTFKIGADAKRPFTCSSDDGDMQLGVVAHMRKVLTQGLERVQVQCVQGLRAVERDQCNRTLYVH